MCYRTGKYTLCRRVCASFSPEILQAGAVTGLIHQYSVLYCHIKLTFFSTAYVFGSCFRTLAVIRVSDCLCILNKTCRIQHGWLRKLLCTKKEMAIIIDNIYNKLFQRSTVCFYLSPACGVLHTSMWFWKWYGAYSTFKSICVPHIRVHCPHAHVFNNVDLCLLLWRPLQPYNSICLLKDCLKAVCQVCVRWLANRQCQSYLNDGLIATGTNRRRIHCQSLIV